MGCGIAGYVGLDDDLLLKRMVASLNHRGPDDRNYYLDSGVGLGIARLSIVDLIGGRQPISNEEGNVWTVLNGEIYNYVELREELQLLGHSFKTASDTEVIVHAYETWGNDCLSRLRGMFAFALWDSRSRSRKLLLAVDRFGKKPIYYGKFGQTFLFGSELKSLLEYDQTPLSIEPSALRLYLTYLNVPAPWSIFKQIEKMRPGSYLTLVDGKVTMQEYWRPSFTFKRAGNADTWVDLLYNVLKESVRIRLRCDVPLGALLSGGIDSSIVVSMMNMFLPNEVTTVSIGFGEADYDELDYARVVAEHLSTNHQEHTITSASINILPRVLWHFDEPFADSAMIPQFYLSNEARKHCTVVLTGDGGDEIFMGYDWMFDSARKSQSNKTRMRLRSRSLVRHPFRSLKHLLAPIATGRQGTENRDKRSENPDKRYYSRINHFDWTPRISPSELNEMPMVKTSGSVIDPFELIQQLRQEAQVVDKEELNNYFTIRNYLANDILVKVDRMSMASSLEARCPLLDHQLAELSFSLPSTAKFDGRDKKIILKKMAAKYELLPIDLIKRRKHGLKVPLKSWFEKEWLAVAKQQLDQKFIVQNLGKAYLQKITGDLHSSANVRRVFSLMMLSLWHQMYIEKTIHIDSKI